MRFFLDLVIGDVRWDPPTVLTDLLPLLWVLLPVSGSEPSFISFYKDGPGSACLDRQQRLLCM